ncbi:MAG: hypothetical protein JSR72_12855 [Proteobacteria bacterium]|nr:hypothetical protein [Pseudomonadota bacterium]
MNRVKDHISFAVWFVGLSYAALWPTAVPNLVAGRIASAAAEPALGCSGLAVAQLQELCQSHEALMLSPGLHLAGIVAACWVTARLFWMPVRRLLRLLAARADWRSRCRRIVGGALKQRDKPPPAPRWVPPRRDFGLRGTSR